MGLFDFFANERVSVYTFMGVNVLNFTFLFLGSNLRHSHVKLKYFSFIETIFISPYQHQIHHSNNPIHFNKNMGSKLAIWDYFFGTLIKSEEVSNLEFGLGKETKRFDTLFKNIINPFF